MCEKFYLLNFELFHWPCLIPDGAIRRTAKSNLLSEIEIKRYSPPSSMENPGLGAAVTDFISILESIDYSKFEWFSNVADEISAKLLLSVFDFEVLVVNPEQYDFEFSIKLLKENAGRKTQLIYRKLKLLVTGKF